MRTWIVLLVAVVGALLLLSCGDGGSDPANDDALPAVQDEMDGEAAAQYRVTISFNEDAVQADIDELGELLASYDEGVEYLIQESFPPTGTAVVATDVDDFCAEILPEIENRSYVTVGSCGPQLEPGDLDHDDPVPDVDLPNGQQTEGSGPDSGAQTSPVCAPDVSPEDCVDVLDTCLEDDCAVEGEDPALPPPDDPVASSGPGEYQLRVSFNETVQQGHLDETAALIAEFAPGAEYVIQESFPPTGVATFVADTEDTCLALVPRLEEESYVNAVSCELRPQLEPGDPDPEEPVTNDLG